MSWARPRDLIFAVLAQIVPNLVVGRTRVFSANIGFAARHREGSGFGLINRYNRWLKQLRRPCLGPRLSPRVSPRPSGEIELQKLNADTDQPALRRRRCRPLYTIGARFPCLVPSFERDSKR